MKNITPGIFWYWNADPTPGGIRRQLEKIKEAGFVSVYLHPMPDSFRNDSFLSGMKCRYLGRKYFALARVMLEECKRLKIFMMLYDEGGWPSGGVLGQLVKKHPECKAKYLVRNENGKGYKEITEDIPDLLDSRTTECFIDMTYELYRREFGEEFGKTIRGIFTDEPFWRCEPGQDKVRIANGMSELMEKNYHCSFETDILPYVFNGAGDHSEVTEARRKYLNICSRLFTENYSMILADWCKRNHLDFEGHLNYEGDYFRTGHMGDLIRQLSPFHVPGIDTIWRQIYPEGGKGNFARLASSVAIRNRRREALCECFNVYGYFLTTPVMSWVANNLFVKGINRILPMPYLYSDRGKRKICCGTDISPRNPIWNAMPALNAFWKWAGDFHTGALEPDVWLFAQIEYPGPDNIWEPSVKHDRAALKIENLIDKLDDAGIFWRLANEQDMEAGRYPKLLIVPSPIKDPEILGMIKKMELAGVQISNGKKFPMNQYAQIDIQDGNGCRILPCNRPEGDALMIFNPSKRETVFRFKSQENWGELLPPDSVSSEIAPVSTEQGITSVPLPPWALRILLKGKAPARVLELKKQYLDLNWTVAHVERLCYSLNGETSYKIDKCDRRLPTSGLYTDLEKDFSGRIILKSEFQLDSPGEGYLVFDEIFYAAELSVNGKNAGCRAFSPWVFKACFVKGKNHLILKISSSGGNEWRRCFREELEPKGWYNNYASGIEKYTIDDAKCGFSGKVVLEK